MLTSNQLYGGLNRRFDRRASLLCRLGFKYVAIAEKIAAFQRAYPFGRSAIIPAAMVMHATNACWRDHLASTLSRGACCVNS